MADDTTYSKTTCDSSVAESNNTTVLGLEWDTNTDEFVFRFEELLSRCSAMEQSKWNLLSVSASILEPIRLDCTYYNKDQNYFLNFVQGQTKLG